MGDLIFYATKKDGDAIRTWINHDPDVAWIVKVAERDDNTCHWKAVRSIDVLHEQRYALWHKRSGPLNIRSDDLHVADAIVEDPFAGWLQKMQQNGATEPWFGSNLPGPYTLRFAESGCEAPGSLGRSDFIWFEDRYKVIGKPAHPDAKRWWRKLRRFLNNSAVRVPWAITTNTKRITMAHVFPDAQLQISQGRHRDVNPNY